MGRVSSLNIGWKLNKVEKSPRCIVSTCTYTWHGIYFLHTKNLKKYMKRAYHGMGTSTSFWIKINLFFLYILLESLRQDNLSINVDQNLSNNLLQIFCKMGYIPKPFTKVPHFQITSILLGEYVINSGIHDLGAAADATKHVYLEHVFEIWFEYFVPVGFYNTKYFSNII